MWAGGGNDLRVTCHVIAFASHGWNAVVSVGVVTAYDEDKCYAGGAGAVSTQAYMGALPGAVW